jgi:hypothetical protein
LKKTFAEREVAQVRDVRAAVRERARPLDLLGGWRTGSGAADAGSSVPCQDRSTTA